MSMRIAMNFVIYMQCLAIGNAKMIYFLWNFNAFFLYFTSYYDALTGISAKCASLIPSVVAKEEQQWHANYSRKIGR